jgi:hypothetical protein
MVFSRCSPQHWGQISPPTPGQCRRARLFSHSLQGTFTSVESLRKRRCEQVSPFSLLSYHREMRRTDLYVKVELDYDDEEKVERLAAEICRVIRKVYGVRKAEVSSMIERET